MRIEKTPLAGLFLINQAQHADARGFFSEVLCFEEIEKATGKPVAFTRELHSHSYKDVLRGMHAEPWDKLFYVAQGTVFSAIADLRPDSSTFGKSRTGILDNAHALYVPQGCANGFCVLSDTADIIYLVSGRYDPLQKKSAVRWDDPDLAIAWPISTPIVSEQDRTNLTLRERFPERFT